jgi:epoxyqueuosine reductase
MKTMPPEPAGATVDLGRFIHDFIEDFLASHDNNNLGSDSQARAWDGFLLGFSSGADDLYQFFKTHIGDFHWTPAEAFALGMAPGQAPDEIAPPPALAPATIVPAAVVPAGELTVVSWALCQTEETRAANRSQTRWPSEPWARARIYGQRCSRALHKAVLEALDSQGYRAVAPALLPQCVQNESPEFGEAYPWSERHVAYASGLGTFGLSGGLITERGKAHRLGSLVLQARIAPTVRPYSDPFEYCLHYATGACTECADRCPAGSIDPGGRDKQACAKHLDPGTADYVKQNYGFDGYGCGLCQTAVPCEARIPERNTPTC